AKRMSRASSTVASQIARMNMRPGGSNCVPFMGRYDRANCPTKLAEPRRPALHLFGCGTLAFGIGQDAYVIVYHLANIVCDLKSQGWNPPIGLNSTMRVPNRERPAHQLHQVQFCCHAADNHAARCARSSTRQQISTHRSIVAVVDDVRERGFDTPAHVLRRLSPTGAAYVPLHVRRSDREGSGRDH